MKERFCRENWCEKLHSSFEMRNNFAIDFIALCANHPTNFRNRNKTSSESIRVSIRCVCDCCFSLSFQLICVIISALQFTNSLPVHRNDTVENKIAKRITLVDRDCAATLTSRFTSISHCNSSILSSWCTWKRVESLMSCREIGKKSLALVSDIVMQIPINICMFWLCDEYISGCWVATDTHTHTQRLREKPRECVHWMRAHFYVNCIRSANSMHAAWCMFTMHVVLAKPVPRVIKAHKNLHACVDNNFSLLCCMSGEWARALVRERATCLHLTYWQVLG